MTDRTVTTIRVEFNLPRGLDLNPRPMGASIHLTPDEFRSFFVNGALLALDDSPVADEFIEAGLLGRVQELHTWTQGLWESSTQIIHSLNTVQEG